MPDLSNPPNAVPAAGAARSRRGPLGRAWPQVRERVQHDWQHERYVPWGLALLLASSLIVIAYYVNHPTPETAPDTATYLAATQHILTSGKLVDPIRTPGYPLLIALAFLLTGQGNLLAVSIIQGILFVAAVLEVYVITCMLTRRAWMALLVGLAVGANTYLLSFIKPVLSEGFSLWVVTTLALALVVFVRTPRVRHLWVVAAFALLAMMTRAEWDYGPVLIFAFMLIIAARHKQLRRLAPHAIAAVLVLYGLLGLYIYENATLNGFAGVTVVERANLLGKVLQYQMQNEAPPQYATVAQEASAFLKAGGNDPYLFAAQYPDVSANNWALANAYSTSIVEHHPLEFALKTAPVIFDSSNTYYERSKINPQGLFGTPLLDLEGLSLTIIALYQVFPFIALFWLLFWLGSLRWRRIGGLGRSPLLEMMGALSLVGFYELVLISAGGYGDYTRLHTAFDPLMLLVICASVLLALAFAAQLLRKSAALTDGLARLWPRIWWVWGGVLLAGVLLSALLTLVSHGLAGLSHLHSWVGFSLVFDHPVRSAPVVVLAVLVTYFIYQAHRLQVSQAANDLWAEHDTALVADPVDPLSEEGLLARQPDRH